MQHLTVAFAEGKHFLIFESKPFSIKQYENISSLCHAMIYIFIQLARLSSTCCSHKPKVLKRHFAALCLDFTPIYCIAHSKCFQILQSCLGMYAKRMEGFKIATQFSTFSFQGMESDPLRLHILCVP